MTAQLFAFIRRIGGLTILGAVIGGQYHGWEGAAIGAFVGWVLDQRFGR